MCLSQFQGFRHSIEAPGWKRILTNNRATPHRSSTPYARPVRAPCRTLTRRPPSLDIPRHTFAVKNSCAFSRRAGVGSGLQCCWGRLGRSAILGEDGRKSRPLRPQGQSLTPTNTPRSLVKTVLMVKDAPWQPVEYRIRWSPPSTQPEPKGKAPGARIGAPAENDHEQGRPN